MEDPDNVFNYQRLLLLKSRTSIKLGQRIEKFVIKEKKLWLYLHEDLEEQVFLDIFGQLVALCNRSPIQYFW